MGRKPTRNSGLPSGMRARHRPSGTYYFLDTGERPRREIALGSDYHLAVMKWAELSIAKHGTTSTITFRYVAEQYMKEVLPKKARRTQQDNLKELDWLYKFFDEPGALLDDIEPMHIRQYLDWREAKVRANREKALFSHIWNFARGKGLTNKTNPCAGIRGNTESGRSIYVEDAVYTAVWELASEPLRDAIELAYLTGQRPADVLKLSRSDIKDGALWVQQNKTSKRLRIVIEGQLAKALDRINARKVVSTGLICTAKGQPFTYAMLRGAFDRARLAASEAHPQLADQIKAYQFRDLRAKAATDTEETAGMDAAQSQLGHTTASMTSHYVRHRKGKLVKPTK